MYHDCLGALRSDIEADREANARGSARVLLWLFRVARATSTLSATPRLLTAPIRVVYRVASNTVFGVEIPLSTTIGPGLTLPHHRGLTIHAATEIGRGTTLRHNVTIGVRRTGDDGSRVPRLGPRVDVGAGAQILGDIRIGADARIGAGAVVLCDVPDGGTAVGNPARVTVPRRS